VRVDGRPTISPAARWFGLRFAGAQGYEELIWELDDGKAAALNPRAARAVAAR
jgi:hypothetical protein